MLLLVPFHAIALPIALPLDATLDRFMLAVMASLWLAVLLIVGGPSSPRIRLTGMHAAVAAFFCIAIVSLVVNNGILMNLGELQVSVKQVALLASYGLFFCLVASIIRPAEVPHFIRLMVGLAAVLAIMTNLEYRLEINPFYDWIVDAPRTARAGPAGPAHDRLLGPHDRLRVDGASAGARARAQPRGAVRVRVRARDAPSAGRGCCASPSPGCCSRASSRRSARPG